MILEEFMEPHPAPAAPLRLALPCYENRVLPRFGAARTFVIADLRRDASAPPACIRKAWDPQGDPPLPAWLRQLGVEGVLCGGIHPRFQTALEAECLWVVWGFRGEIETVLQEWLAAGSPTQTPDPNKGFVSCCRLPQPAACKPARKYTCKRREKP